MNTRNLETGVRADEQQDLDTLLGELKLNLDFIPGSQLRTAIGIDQLKLLMRAAKDGQVALTLYESASLAEEELSSLGREEAAPFLGKAISQFVELHPELS